MQVFFPKNFLHPLPASFHLSWSWSERLSLCLWYCNLSTLVFTTSQIQCDAFATKSCSIGVGNIWPAGQIQPTETLDLVYKFKRALLMPVPMLGPSSEKWYCQGLGSFVCTAATLPPPVPSPRLEASADPSWQGEAGTTRKKVLEVEAALSCMARWGCRENPPPSTYTETCHKATWAGSEPGWSGPRLGSGASPWCRKRQWNLQGGIYVWNKTAMVREREKVKL